MIEKETLGLAGEYAVASELCRRNIYAQLTLGNKKRTDILATSKNGNGFIKIEAKAKQGKSWPSCIGISDKNALLVFVDYANKNDDERPDFFILDSKDWKLLVNKRIKEITKGRPHVKMELSKENVPTAPNQKTKSGKAFPGVHIFPENIKTFKENWDKIEKKLR